MIRINTGADLSDLFGGQTDFEIAVEWSDGADFEIIGAGHTVAQAVADARETLRAWDTAPKREPAPTRGAPTHPEACPTCSAARGAPCVYTGTGFPRFVLHQARKEAATNT